MVAVGPMLDPVLDAVAGMDVSVLYANTVRPFDQQLCAVARHAQAALVEPYLTGTSARCVNDALVDVPHRLLSLGVARGELRRYGAPADHAAAHGLDALGIKRSVEGFLAA